MFSIFTETPSQSFLECWVSAGKHLNRLLPKELELGGWFKSTPTPPFLEHLSFRLGNQIFLVRLEDEAGVMRVPGTRRGLFEIAKGMHGHACLMPMRQAPNTGTWSPVHSGWGLVDARTGATVHPPELVTTENIELTPWELLDFAVQVVRDSLREEGRQIMSTQNNPSVDPSIWFIGERGTPEWVVVRPVRYPAKEAPWPANWQDIALSCSKLSNIGHFASVVFTSLEQDLVNPNAQILPILRGRAVDAVYEGLR